MINLSSLTSHQLKRAAAIKDQIEALHLELANLTGEETAAPATPAAKPARKKISAAGIARIKAAQKLRWAKIKGGKTSVAKVAAKTAAKSTAKPAGKRSKMSAAARAKIAAAAKARWAAVKAAGKKKL